MGSSHSTEETDVEWSEKMYVVGKLIMNELQPCKHV